MAISDLTANPVNADVRPEPFGKAMSKITEVTPTDAIAVGDQVLRARAILNCYIDSIGDDRADDRYVLWTVAGILSDVAGSLECLPQPSQPATQAAAKSA